MNIQVDRGTCVVVNRNQVMVNGEELPPAPSRGNSTSIVNNKVFIDGYEFKHGKWRRTLRALWHLFVG